MGAWVLAGFPEEKPMVEAAGKLRGEGYTLELFTPFPSPDGYEVLPGPSMVPLFTLCGGVAGVCIGFFFQWWANAFNFPIIVGGRPFFSIPTYVPICFECMVLLASFSGLYCFFIACRLPKLDHPLAGSELFARHTIDRFVLAVRWERETPSDPLEQRLHALGAAELDPVRDS